MNHAHETVHGCAPARIPPPASRKAHSAYLLRLALFLALAVSLLPCLTVAAENPPSEQELIQLIQSQAPSGEKAIACKKLAIFGSAQAVPALAALLPDPSLSSWARIALEAIPGPAADEALRNALPKLQGGLLIGTMNSIGVRRDPQAVKPLIAKLGDPDAEVVSAAAVALGRIGGDRASSALRKVVQKGPEAVKQAAAEGCVRCAEGFLAAGKPSSAMKLYDTVRKAKIPEQQMLDATRGAILARGARGVPLLVEQLRAADRDVFRMALSTARELPGPEATKAVADELRLASPERQPLVLLALADRGDPAAMPAIVEAARSGTLPTRLAAVEVLERMGNVSTVPLLLESASGAEPELSQAAKTALIRLHGTNVDQAIVQQLPPSRGKSRQALIEVAGRRGLEAALPEILKAVGDPDEATRVVALQAVGILGGGQHVPELVAMLKQTPDAKAQAQIEQALLSICGREGSGCVPAVQKLATDDSGAVRVVAIHALAASGGAEALAVVRQTAQDRDETVQDEAVRTLSSWPNTWPEDAAIAEVLLELAKSASKPAHQVLALRGYLQYVEGDKKLSEKQKVDRVTDVVPLLQRAEEKRTAIGVVQRVNTPGALLLLANFSADSAVADDACAALLAIAGKERRGISKEERQQALQTVVEKCKDDATKQKADQLLKSL